MTTLATAIQRRDWDWVAHCLLVGVVEAAATLPPEAVEGLLDVLSGMEEEDVHRRRSRSPQNSRTRRGRRR